MKSNAMKRKNNGGKDTAQPSKKNKQHHTHKRDTPMASSTSTGKGGLSALQQKFQKQLEGARFRSINETLYTCTGQHSFAEFSNDPSLFEAYHEGYRQQVTSWPQNPLDIIISLIEADRKGKKIVIADVGCGEARLAHTIKGCTIHSFDLVAANPAITACDMSSLPLPDGSVDVAVYCLSLMGTNVADFLSEANRILKVNGIVYIAEVRSRFEGEKQGLKKFFRTLKKFGFDVSTKDFSNTMFFILKCVKSGRSVVRDDEFTIKPCIYKKR